MNIRSMLEGAVRAAEFTPSKTRQPSPLITAGLLLRAMSAPSALDHARHVVRYLESVVGEEPRAKAIGGER